MSIWMEGKPAQVKCALTQPSRPSVRLRTGRNTPTASVTSVVPAITEGPLNTAELTDLACPLAYAYEEGRMPITVSEGGEWIERLSIADLIYRYSDSVTRADWDRTEAVFAPDAIWESPALGLRFEGARTYRDFLAGTTGYDLLIQTAHPPVILLVGPQQAQTTTTVHELVRGVGHTDSTLGEAGTPVNLEQYGIYCDDVAKLDGEWKFTHRLFVPLYVRVDCVTGQVLRPRFALSRPHAL